MTPAARAWVMAVVATLAVAGGAGAEEGVELTLGRALTLARSGPAVAAAVAAIDEAASLKAQAASAFRPQVDLAGSYVQRARDLGMRLQPGTFGNPEPLGFPASERNVWVGAVEVRQLLWDGGRSRALLAAAGHGRAAAEAGRAAAARAVERATIEAYAGAVAAARLTQAAAKQVEELDSVVAQVGALVDQQQLPEADRLQAQAAAAQAHLALIDAQARAARALAGLEELVGEPVGAVAPLPVLAAPPAGIEAEVWVARAAAGRPELAALRDQVAALTARGAAARAGRRPSLFLTGSASHVEDDFQLHQNNAEAQVAVRVPLFEGGLSRARETEQAAAATRVAAELDSLFRQIRREVADGVTRLGAAGAAVVASQAACGAAEEALRQADLRYREGLISNRELLDAEAVAVAARQRLAVAEAEQVAARLALENLTGRDVTAAVTAHEAAAPARAKERVDG
ncbi:MAG: hypothetical protein COW73_05800 [Nitrospirae bacterium CG18_big_fil_WC_8_21_14_2_50_70_55]|nr:TolC family protein [Deltaproteobacteria bacterium]PIQ05537.1 MAG: hypothetical protein COW73_05800 [Nitrospirae bacterium CG18_big_fil_WC_8_21_14_2_50_70_55]PIU78264.1 MAG: hypothetical protein COS73_07720 [Nitrospirae bacterium CG06_land_8_20_14_3_00_70_43]PIW82792.1 MAG: hypothetical protein COZ96_06950 [Nitrospirae bacterium CG_4_8_14_3_um_filter_70_85]PIX84276.1 MAG: hypothetical protein COZ33_01140 [Nitrospirae bacterium CG_4_10_14_3_um_filter_70_108]